MKKEKKGRENQGGTTEVILRDVVPNIGYNSIPSYLLSSISY